MIYRSGSITWLEVGEIPGLPEGSDLTLVIKGDDVLVYDRRTSGKLRFMTEVGDLEHEALRIARIRADLVTPASRETREIG